MRKRTMEPNCNVAVAIQANWLRSVCIRSGSGISINLAGPGGRPRTKQKQQVFGAEAERGVRPPQQSQVGTSGTALPQNSTVRSQAVGAPRRAGWAERAGYGSSPALER